jgi:hypothetical protein
METREYRQEQPEPAHPGILRNFARAVLNHEPLLSPGPDGLLELSISNAAYLSSWTGRTISLPLDQADEKQFKELLRDRAEQNKTGSVKTAKENAPQDSAAYSSRWSVRW